MQRHEKMKTQSKVKTQTKIPKYKNNVYLTHKRTLFRSNKIRTEKYKIYKKYS